MSNFNYDEAFSRNLGLVTPKEQLILKTKKVAMGGMGGVGGQHLLTLSRMGISNFNIADHDNFELANFNRQAGALVSTIGKPKAATMKERALDINPECNITVFPNGITPENVDEFLDGVSVYVDGVDFFVTEIRKLICRKCREKNIPVISSAPLGVSTAYIIFDPKGMSFDEYFQLDGKGEIETSAYFLVGLAPNIAHLSHFVDFSYVSFKDKRGSSLAPACMACSAVIGAEVLKILLGRGKVYYAPWVMQFDMYHNRYHKIYNWLGNRNPINWLKIKFMLSKVSGDKTKT